MEEDRLKLGEGRLQHIVKLRLPERVAIEILEGHILPADEPILELRLLELLVKLIRSRLLRLADRGRNDFVLGLHA